MPPLHQLRRRRALLDRTRLSGLMCTVISTRGIEHPLQRRDGRRRSSLIAIASLSA